MPSNEVPLVSTSRRGKSRVGSSAPRTVVWLRGEHDISNRVHLAASIAEAAQLDDDDIVVDLSGVTFMDASTIAALVAARHRLGAPSRSLSVRAPSPPARRLLDLCRLATLIEDHTAPARPPMAAALGTWVDVPSSDRVPDATEPPVTQEHRSRESVRSADASPHDESSHDERDPSHDAHESASLTAPRRGATARATHPRRGPS